jgi:hypothetical protein
MKLVYSVRKEIKVLFNIQAGGAYNNYCPLNVYRRKSCLDHMQAGDLVGQVGASWTIFRGRSYLVHMREEGLVGPHARGGAT